MKSSESSALFIKLLLNKYCGNSASQVMTLAPEEMQKEIGTSSSSSVKPESLLFPSEIFFHMHYSWLEAVVESLPAPIRPCFIAALPPEVAKRLYAVYQLSELQRAYSPQVQNFLLHILSTHFDKSTPRSLLEPSSLDALLDCSKAELVLMVDLLAMYDLAEEIRYIVDKRILQGVLMQLSPQQQRYLKVVLHKQTSRIGAPLLAHKLYQDKQRFVKELHKRGLEHFARALSNESVDFIWHVAHILDRGRGKIIMSIAEQKAKERSAAQDMSKPDQMILTAQQRVRELLQLLTREREASHG